MAVYAFHHVIRFPAAEAHNIFLWHIHCTHFGCEVMPELVDGETWNVKGVLCSEKKAGYAVWISLVYVPLVPYFLCYVLRYWP